MERIGQAIMNLGRRSLSVGDLEAALRAFKDARSTISVRELEAYADEFAESGDAKAAIDVYGVTDSATKLEALADSLLAQGDVESAIIGYEQLKKALPTEKITAFGDIFRCESRFDLALAYYSRAGDIIRLRELGDVCAEARLDLAIQAYEQAGAVDRLLTLAQRCSAEGWHGAARDCYDAAHLATNGGSP